MKGADLEESLLAGKYGLTGCISCKAFKCRWRPSIDIEAQSKRVKELNKEIERVKIDHKTKVFTSDVCLSAMKGGTRVFRKSDLLDELNFEVKELNRQIELNMIDKECHDAYNHRQQYFTCKVLHGFQVQLWTKNARGALSHRVGSLVAQTISYDIVDDILDYMLVGWYFGETNKTVADKRENTGVDFLKNREEERKTEEMGKKVEALARKKRAEARKLALGLVNSSIDEDEDTIEKKEKWLQEMEDKMSIKDIKVARDGNIHQNNLNEYEKVIKFGMWMLSLMYFRAIFYIRESERKKKAKFKETEEHKSALLEFEDAMEAEEKKNLAALEEAKNLRKKKVKAILSHDTIGNSRRLHREAEEKVEIMDRLQAVIRRQELELQCVSSIQKVFRGHLHRKACKKWILKRKEFEAINELLSACAIAVQRIFRGFVAREFAVFKRIQMYQFISLMRVQEAQADEEIYWQTHPWARYKKANKKWMKKMKKKYLSKPDDGKPELTAEEKAELDAASINKVIEEQNAFLLDDEDGEEQDDYEEEEEEEDVLTADNPRSV